MHDVMMVLSFPFWLLGAFFVLLALFANTVTWKGREAYGLDRLLLRGGCLIVGMIPVGIAYFLCNAF